MLLCLQIDWLLRTTSLKFYCFENKQSGKAYDQVSDMERAMEPPLDTPRLRILQSARSDAESDDTIQLDSIKYDSSVCKESSNCLEEWSNIVKHAGILTGDRSGNRTTEQPHHSLLICLFFILCSIYDSPTCPAF